MNGDKGERTISSRANIGISITSLAGLVIGFGLFLYSQVETLREDTSSRFSEARSVCNARYQDFEVRLDEKANTAEAKDRYTGTQAEERAKSVDQQLSDIKAANAYAHRVYERAIDHLAEDIAAVAEQCKKRHE
ncbi:MAG: hypothetical protein KJO69_02430 [Gammaproteobacteria bacterium]|nr:hypothetical protein [Gammaproteobacteria bacterium]